MYTENELAIRSNDSLLNDLPGELYTIEAIDKILYNCQYRVTVFHSSENGINKRFVKVA